ncbi:MAG: hypothetical protein ACR2H5_16655 [Ktedonobacteraceae bacterium]
MDIYRALNADVPLSLFTILHQTAPTLSREEYEQLVKTLHNDVSTQTESLGNELLKWQQKQYLEQAEEMGRKLQRLGFLSEDVDTAQLQDVLLQDYHRMGSRIGSRSLVGLLGAAEIVLDEAKPVDAELAHLADTGQRYLATLGFKQGLGMMHESCLLFRGSVHYDIIEHLVRNRTELQQGKYAKSLAHILHMAISAYDLVYQTGEGLSAEPNEDVPMQQVAFAINKGNIPYSLFRRNISNMMEDVGEHVLVFHASFWQRKLGLGIGKEFVLRFRLLAGEEHLRSLIDALQKMGTAGKEVVLQGALMVGKRIV